VLERMREGFRLLKEVPVRPEFEFSCKSYAMEFDETSLRGRDPTFELRATYNDCVFLRFLEDPKTLSASF